VAALAVDPGRPRQRARIVLLAGDGIGTNKIVARTGVSKPTVIAWKMRFAAEGLAAWLTGRSGGVDGRPMRGDRAADAAPGRNGSRWHTGRPDRWPPS
jgi:hypothetical protein